MPTDDDVLTWDSSLGSNQKWAAPSGGTGAAEDITFTPAGTIAATDVQAAIEEVAAEAGGGGGYTEVAYAQVTSPVSISSTTEGSANTIVTAGAFTADGTSAYHIEFYSPIVLHPAGGQAIFFILFQDGSAIGQIGAADENADAVPMYCARRMIPASGSRTYSIRAYCGSGGSATVYGEGGGSATYMPAFIRITKVT